MHIAAALLSMRQVDASCMRNQLIRKIYFALYMTAVPEVYAAKKWTQSALLIGMACLSKLGN